MEFDISSARLQSQLLKDPKFKSAKDGVQYFGAMQAQDYQMSKWAVGVRLPDATDALIEKALDKGEIIRTHILRPTWHLVASDDIHWMLELTGQNVMRQMGSSSRMLDLDEKIFAKSNNIISKALEDGSHLTREELMEILHHCGIKTNELRGLHLLFYAELSGVICSGERKGKHHSYGLLDQRVKKTKNFTKEEALAELGNRYFTSHGPASQKDFAWWSGLSIADSKLAIELNKTHLISEILDGQTYYRKDFEVIQAENSVLLLPAFDEFLIAYKDRSASIHNDHSKHAFTNNGIFRPIIVVNGQVCGTWKRTIKKDKVIIETNIIQKITKVAEKQIRSEVDRFGEFLDKTVEIA
jgi:hypothetical protein